MRNPFDATGTIGHRPSELALGKILAERNDPKLTGRVIKVLQVCRKTLKSLNDIKDPRCREYFDTIYKYKVEEILANKIGMPVRGSSQLDPLASHAMCCITTYFRESREAYEHKLTPEEQKAEEQEIIDEYEDEVELVKEVIKKQEEEQKQKDIELVRKQSLAWIGILIWAIFLSIVMWYLSDYIQ